MANYIINQELNGIEISFDAKPEAATLESLKANGYRWHRAKKVWYAKQTAARLELAKAITDTTAPIAAPAPAKDKETINLDNLGVKPENFSFYGAELAKFIRDDLKRRGVNGVTVRSRKITHATGITVTVKATPEDFASVEEMKTRYPYQHFTCHTDRGFYDGEKWVYNFDQLSDDEKESEYDKYIRYQGAKLDGASHYVLTENRDHYWELSTPFYKKLCAVFQIANQWNYDHSDSMTDYFDVGYYLDIDIKKADDFTLRETMTDEEKAAYKAEKEQEAVEEAAALAKYEQEQKEAEERRKAYEEQEKKDTAAIMADITIEDIEPLYISDLSGGIGKECNLDELNENIGVHTSDAVITRKATFSNMDIFETFGKYLLNDWDFVAGKGGTASEDSRLTSENFHHLNEDQRESIKWYMCDCIGVYVNNALMLVINPEGYSYPRYCYKPTENTTTTAAAGVLKDQAKASKALPSFYFPESVEKQAENIHEGQKITVYQTDGWNLCSVYGGFGTVLSVEHGTYAQYKGVYITLIRGGKSHRVFIRDSKKTLIYDEILPPLPDTLTKRRIDEQTSMLLNADELFPLILDYYGKQGKNPILDTIQR